MKKSEKKRFKKECEEKNQELILKYNIDDMVEEIEYFHQADFMIKQISLKLLNKSVRLLKEGKEY